MSDGFFDTNVLLYLLSRRTAKAEMAEALLLGGGTVSVQVLNEFAFVARRKFKASWEAVHDSLDAIRASAAVEPISLETHELGLYLSERHVLSIFDGQLVAAALLAKCKVFYSEDLHHGLQIPGGPLIQNPFANLVPPGNS